MTTRAAKRAHNDLDVDDFNGINPHFLIQDYFSNYIIIFPSLNSLNSIHH